MCLALPSMVAELLDDEIALVELGGVTKEVSLALVDDVSVGDYVIVHVGYALSKVNAEEAAKTLSMFTDMKEAGALFAATA